MLRHLVPIKSSTLSQTQRIFHSLTETKMEQPKGTLVFSTVGRPHYGFDLFSLRLHSSLEHRLTDGRSINFNAQFAHDNHSIVFISDRTGSPAIYLTRPGNPTTQLLHSVPGSLFHDRPIIKNGKLYFISAHEEPDRLFTSWSALYSTDLNDEKEKKTTRLTPPGSVDYSPAVSLAGEFVAVASYGSRPWEGEFHELNTDIVVFRASQPEKRVLLCERGGWPTWSCDSVVYFHRRDDDGWWTIFRVDLPHDFESAAYPLTPTRVTPSGLHCFTPAAMHDGKRIAVATRRSETKFRHVEIFDAETETFRPVTSTLNPDFHHYNPFVSPDSEFIGYHRFRGESTQWGGESIIPYVQLVNSPIGHLRMLRLHGSFPTFSPDADFVAFNPDFERNTGVKIVKSDGSKCWTLITGRTAFYNSWSPTERHVIYTSIGPIFQSAKATVQIARIEFDPSDLNGEKEDIPCSVKILTREDTGNNAFASCSLDGKSLVFRSGRTGHKNLYIVDAVNGEFNGGIRRLTDGPCIDTMPSWSPKGDLIAFSSNRHKPEDDAVFSIYVIKPDGSGLRRIHVAGDDVGRERVNHVCFSHDGEWLLFTANLGGVTAEPVSFPNQFQPYGDLYMVRLDGSGLRRLTWNGYENGTPTWNTGDDMDLGRLRLGAACEVGDKLNGQFDEPLWISCDI